MKQVCIILIQDTIGNYWRDLTINSLVAGLLSTIGWYFGNASEILKNLNFKSLFAATAVWSEFIFSYLTDSISTLLDYLGKIFRNSLFGGMKF